MGRPWRRMTGEDRCTYRSAAGTLLYMAGDRPDIQFHVKELAGRLQNPTGCLEGPGEASWLLGHDDGGAFGDEEPNQEQLVREEGKRSDNSTHVSGSDLRLRLVRKQVDEEFNFGRLHFPCRQLDSFLRPDSEEHHFVKY